MSRYYDPRRVHRKGPRTYPPLLQVDVEYAQQNTQSHAQAARFLNISYERYRRFARMYDLWDNHLNQAGKHLHKILRNTTTSIRELLEGKHPNYDRQLLEVRLRKLNILKYECELCGYRDQRPGGGGPYIMVHRDKDMHNFLLSNLTTYCYNCVYLATGTIKIYKHEAPDFAPEVYERDAAEQLSDSDISDLQDEFLRQQS